ncbi:pentatricopeptide repeat-containing protein [Nicotiana attenuata]|uniref:Pentatricopeptide repeat-containing protein n=1 Tax=Nicotiana attenuata TaxID=49451 RepID=A0A1J6I296_NICAT|nr:pentatricopeptide repeat-containing protein [Nicotiana attenuata]
MPERSLPLYTALIGSCSKSEQWNGLLFILQLMIDEGLMTDNYRKGIIKNVFVSNALIHMYANCGELESSEGLFNSMEEKDVVSWTALLSAYMNAGLVEEAERVFHWMTDNKVKPDLKL